MNCDAATLTGNLMVGNLDKTLYIFGLDFLVINAHHYIAVWYRYQIKPKNCIIHLHNKIFNNIFKWLDILVISMMATVMRVFGLMKMIYLLCMARNMMCISHIIFYISHILIKDTKLGTFIFFVIVLVEVMNGNIDAEMGNDPTLSYKISNICPCKNNHTIDATTEPMQSPILSISTHKPTTPTYNPTINIDNDE